MHRSTLSYCSLAFVLAMFFACKSPVSRSQDTDKNLQGSQQDSGSERSSADSAFAHQYAFEDLKTDFSKHTIPLDSIYDGGPSKNGIPAIDFPQFVSAEEAVKFLSEPDYGILVQGKTETKFYSYSILNWHEIVNDKIDGVPVVVTFCPLCGSAIVFERVINGDTLDFGVSGKLYESNLLMFDSKTESLWSQAMGQAVAGSYTRTKLKLVNSTVTSFDDILKYFPHALVLSTKTGFERNYMQYPYADYLSNEDLYFPVSRQSSRYSPKDIMYIVPAGNTSVAFAWLPLLKAGKAIVKTDAGTITVKLNKNIPSASISPNGESLPGYFSFWFSWYAVNGSHGIVWDPE